MSNETQTPTAPASAEAPKRRMGITLSDRAVKQLQLMEEERKNAGGGLRLAVKGGGCSGLSYDLSWEPQPKEKDRVFERDGARVFVDPKSYLYLNGSELDYQQTLMARGFKLQNPNVKGSCGCGDSFSV